MWSYPFTCLEGLVESTKILSQDNRFLGRDLNRGPPEKEAGVLTTTSWIFGRAYSHTERVVEHKETSD
jgi:hypothetical protein